jgi:ATP-dependent DNA helicase RecG
MKSSRSWTGSVQYLKGVGPVRARALSRLGIETAGDLLLHFPRRYLDRSETQSIGKAQVGAEVTLTGVVMTSGERRIRGGRKIQTIAVNDETGTLYCQWFGQSYILKSLRAGAKVILSGKLQLRNGNRQLVHPDYEVIEADAELLHTGRLVPVYGLTSGIGQHWLRKLILAVLESDLEPLPDALPAALRQEFDLMDRARAIREIHLPTSAQALEGARKRLIFEEIFLVQLAMGQRRSRRMVDSGIVLSAPGDLTRKLVDALAFQLTGAQRRVLSEILADMRGGQVMHRLLQGDVGSGKTLVALIAALFVIEQGYQAMLMAPTEVLAIQHEASIGRMLEPLGISRALVTGSTPSAEKRSILAGVFAGEIDLLIGTHALIQEGVALRNPGLVIVDEQHRFGVRQRKRAGDDAVKSRSPHMLVMSATPIPRSLALTLCADLDLSVIDEMPSGRLPITTELNSESDLAAVHAQLLQELQAGQQAYIVYPVIEETEGQDLKAAETEYAQLKEGVLKDCRVGLLHGRLKPAQKKEIMADFAAGRLQVLVATTVVEVGLDVPAATRMLIHNPERFGLAQLHQLRGRIGRGQAQSTCHLIIDRWLAEPSLERLRVFAATNDGFKLAEHDLRLRGPGDILGVRQHGLPVFRLANPLRDGEIVKTCATLVDDLLARDPELKSPRNRVLAEHAAGFADRETLRSNTG